ncbi:PREDICTED: uncharacterized protein LOC109214249, partial [Nicotiana attenuata]|uniref:uncharacterized protein LOC109214249 n=1 Tax=Nicotiana attenuata TaxID=49451 RepID=UPI000904B207
MDPGSSANIIQWRVLEQAKLTGSIIPATKLLAGFNLASVTTRGEILLPTNAEGVMKTTLFEVVDGDMGYNIILRRPWLHEMRAEPEPAQESDEVSPRVEASESYQVPRYFQVREDDAAKSTAEELKQVTLFEEFLERKFHLGIGLHPEL